MTCWLSRSFYAVKRTFRGNILYPFVLGWNKQDEMEVERHYFNNGGEEISPSRGENLSKLIPEKKRSFLILDRKERKKVVPRDKFSNVESILRNRLKML